MWILSVLLLINPVMTYDQNVPHAVAPCFALNSKIYSHMDMHAFEQAQYSFKLNYYSIFY